MDRTARGYWDEIALRWRISEPLAPGRTDIDWFERQAARHADEAKRALLLGVTAGIVLMRWPADTRLTAADWSTNMLKIVWPAGAVAGTVPLLCADWRELPLRGGSVGLIAGDGCYTALGTLAGAAALNAEMHRVLRRGGIVLMRCFCRPAAGLRVDELFEQLLSRRIRNLDLFRWMLAMALQGDAARGVAVREIGEQWARRVPDARALQARMGWTDDALANMERMAAATMTYNFASLEELLCAAAPAFELVERDVPDYDWGELFPRIVLRAR
jgi:SAM-dependent methyltransferase